MMQPVAPKSLAVRGPLAQMLQSQSRAQEAADIADRLEAGGYAGEAARWRANADSRFAAARRLARIIYPEHVLT